jgi:hypothetical protein
MAAIKALPSKTSVAVEAPQEHLEHNTATKVRRHGWIEESPQPNSVPSNPSAGYVPLPPDAVVLKTVPPGIQPNPKVGQSLGTG